MRVEVKARAGANNFLAVSPAIESWGAPAADDGDLWYIGARIETSRLLPDVEERFLTALRKILFYTFKKYDEEKHVVFIRDWVYGLQQDALYELAEDFGLTVQKDC